MWKSNHTSLPVPEPTVEQGAREGHGGSGDSGQGQTRVALIRVGAKLWRESGLPGLEFRI